MLAELFDLLPRPRGHLAMLDGPAVDKLGGVAGDETAFHGGGECRRQDRQHDADGPVTNAARNFRALGFGRQCRDVSRALRAQHITGRHQTVECGLELGDGEVLGVTKALPALRAIFQAGRRDTRSPSTCIFSSVRR